MHGNPRFDSEGRFWVYCNGPTRPPMPFVPYGWMSDATNVTQLIRVDLNCHEQPYTDSKSPSASSEPGTMHPRGAWTGS